MGDAGFTSSTVGMQKVLKLAIGGLSVRLCIIYRSLNNYRYVLLFYRVPYYSYTVQEPITPSVRMIQAPTLP